MASRGRGAKAKGSAFERKIAEALRRSGLDPNAGRMPLSGADSHLKGDVRTELPYTIEAKCQERVQLWKWWEQAKEQAHYNPPLLFVSANYRPTLAIMDIETLVNLLLCEKQLNETLTSESAINKSARNCSQNKYKRKVSGEVVER